LATWSSSSSSFTGAVEDLVFGADYVDGATDFVSGDGTRGLGGVVIFEPAGGAGEAGAGAALVFVSVLTGVAGAGVRASSIT
jgi:hypothetical protein